MKRFVVAHCFVSDNYFGHRLMHVEAENMEDAEQKFYVAAGNFAGKGRLEYCIMEETSQFSYRVYNSKTRQRE